MTTRQEKVTVHSGYAKVLGMDVEYREPRVLIGGFDLN